MIERFHHQVGMSIGTPPNNFSEVRPIPEQNELLSRMISELSLKIPGTRLEALIQQLYHELEAAGITFRPKTYLSDEWGCPQGVPVIGIPFYLADPKLAKLEGELTGVEAENEAEVMMYLRHEAGHAFNYAYLLYNKLSWRRLFGRFSRPYKDKYYPRPFSVRFVHHIPGWYAQKHPDEDFAETFAVWLTPNSGWRERYANTPALEKLKYVDRVAKRYGKQEPEVTTGELDTPVEELAITLDKWYATGDETNVNKLAWAYDINDHLNMLFPDREGKPAAEILTVHRRAVVNDVNHWTGINRQVLNDLYKDLHARIKGLELKINPDLTAARMISLAVFLTTLAMNYQRTGRFMDK